uniref:Uncharacterized protein n=1 Tax=viral metagenome TaxID=1070528 RepID=A0A6C0I3I3_9ZZZZ
MSYDNEDEYDYGYANDEESEIDMYQDQYEEESDELASDTNAKKRRLWNDSLVDKSFHKIKRGGRTIGIYSSSNTPGFTIKNAVTGTYCEHKIGSLYEHLYYKIKLATGELGRESLSFFFDSPEQCERHMDSEIPQETKGKWHQKYMIAKRQLLQ